MKAAANPFRGYRPAKPARFDASSQHRRSLIAKVKIAQKQLGLCDDDYRAVLLKVTGETSAAHCTDVNLRALLDHFKTKGFQPKPVKGKPRAADHPAANKARAMWISLYYLNAVRDPSEPALEAFAKRQLKCERLQWADQGQMFKLVEALKSWAEREGWSQDVAAPAGADASHKLKLLKINLLRALVGKLVEAGLAEPDWRIVGCAIQMAGFEKAQISGPLSWDDGELDMLAREFGHLLRTCERGSRL